MIYLIFSFFNKLIALRIPLKLLFIFADDCWLLILDIIRPVLLSPMDRPLWKVSAEQSSGIRGWLCCSGNKEKIL